MGATPGGALLHRSWPARRHRAGTGKAPEKTAFNELDLHRIQAETLLHNMASQRVLERNGFVRIGLAPTYLKIAGRWQDCILYQVINDRAAEPDGKPSLRPVFTASAADPQL